MDLYSFLSGNIKGFLLNFTDGETSTEKLHVLARDQQQVTGMIFLGTHSGSWSLTLSNENGLG